MEPLTEPVGAGLLLVDKPVGLSSARVVAIVKRLSGASKVGHGGTLDPFASGLLPVLIGRQFTREAGTLLEGDKEYEFTLRLGSETDTGDLTGRAHQIHEGPLPDDRALLGVLSRFTGDIVQEPPAFSALKLDGRPLYWYARRGMDVKKPARSVVIHRLELVEYLPPDARFNVACSKGTYIRSLGRDLGRALGSLGHLVALRRTAVGPYRVEQAHPLWRLRQTSPTGRPAC